ncbi:hypothetical protein H2198_002937 [Neophaeococcomyces mojaviensis]|uniref:Uncharacterized protein n=1 Tax=Neophaeococcomyces mojaviensis TaxID=3383035 RepID=A0ACC3ADU8_9EURO|nr:hypothetical protein H2198_002937 [Knufia sp. JES_112]
MTERLTHPTEMSGESSTNTSMASSNTGLSPKDISLPPSPPFDSDDDSDTPARRPARFKRGGSESNISTRPIIHQIPIRPRNQSPSTLMPRPHTSVGLALPMKMERAHSSPGVDSSGRFITLGYTVPRRPASPLSSGRRRSPLRSAMEESFPVSWSGLNIEPNIPEHAELDLSSFADGDLSQLSHVPAYHNTFPRSRRRPASPLHTSASTPTLYSSARASSPHTTGTSSPSTRYYTNEPYPTTFTFSSASSMPSTPSSFRSRSPSISSLETIEDSPDAEEAAQVAADEDAKYRAEEADPSGGTRKSSLDSRGATLRSNKERKRWSVCGAERRADFSLEPIEE